LRSKDLNARYFGTSRYYYRYGYGNGKDQPGEATMTGKVVKNVMRFFKKDG
jgi:hypothetical protein